MLKEKPQSFMLAYNCTLEGYRPRINIRREEYDLLFVSNVQVS